jgi:hypothetical protein
MWKNAVLVLTIAGIASIASNAIASRSTPPAGKSGAPVGGSKIPPLPKDVKQKIAQNLKGQGLESFALGNKQQAEAVRAERKNPTFQAAPKSASFSCPTAKDIRAAAIQKDLTLVTNGSNWKSELALDNNELTKEKSMVTKLKDMRLYNDSQVCKYQNNTNNLGADGIGLGLRRSIKASPSTGKATVDVLTCRIPYENLKQIISIAPTPGILTGRIVKNKDPNGFLPDGVKIICD